MQTTGSSWDRTWWQEGGQDEMGQQASQGGGQMGIGRRGQRRAGGDLRQSGEKEAERSQAAGERRIQEKEGSF